MRQSSRDDPQTLPGGVTTSPHMKGGAYLGLDLKVSRSRSDAAHHDTKSPLSLSRANWPSSSGTCSTATRTTPSPTHPDPEEIRRMALTAGSLSRKGHRNPSPTGLSVTQRRQRKRAICQQAETAYRCLVTGGNEQA